MSSSQTNFDKIKEFHAAFGLQLSETHDHSVLDNEKLLKLRVDLIAEEFKELQDAIHQKDFTEVRDAIGDILYVTYGAAASFGINADHDYDIIHQSNMTKLCKTEQEAIDTVSWYKEQYDLDKTSYDTPDYRKSDDDIHWVVFNKSSGKILKSIHYKPVNFSE